MWSRGRRRTMGCTAPLLTGSPPSCPRTGLLFVGDCKMSALATRAHIRALGHHYLMPLALVGETGKEMRQWIQEAVDGTQPLIPVYAADAQDGEEPLAHGYERTRAVIAQEGDQTLEWTERVFVVHSPVYADTMKRGLERRLQTASAKLAALTPPRERGKRQITDEATLIEAANATVQQHKVEGLLSYTFERQVEQEVK